MNNVTAVSRIREHRNGTKLYNTKHRNGTIYITANYKTLNTIYWRRICATSNF